MTDREMIAIAHKGLLIGPSPLLRHNAAARRAEMEGVVMTCWGAVGAGLNKVTVVGLSPPLSRILELADGFFGAGSKMSAVGGPGSRSSLKAGRSNSGGPRPPYGKTRRLSAARSRLRTQSSSE